MKLTNITRWKKIDFGILISGIFLVLISLAILYSLELNQEITDFSLLRRQAASAILGAIICLVWFFLDYRHLKDYAFLLYVFGLLLLFGLFLFGVNIRGTTGWFQFGVFSFQPVELFKLILIIFLSSFYLKSSLINNLSIFIKSFLIFFIPAFLVVLQPDLGSLIVLAIIWIGYLFILKLHWQYFLGLILAGLLFFLIAWQFLLAPYQKARITSFIFPEKDIAGSAYNLRQSKIAIGSAGFLGRGLGLGTQSSLRFLPEPETDFIFAVIAESLGFLGACLLIGLYFFLLWRILLLVNRLKDEFAVFLVLGIFFWFAFQGIFNIAMNLGLMPITGIPLPLVSYGGSSLLVSLVALGILESVCIFSPKAVSGEFSLLKS